MHLKINLPQLPAEPQAPSPLLLQSQSQQITLFNDLFHPLTTLCSYSS